MHMLSPIFFPVLSLPTELSLTIFREVCLGSTDSKAGLSNTNPQIILSQVCKSWRSMVLSYPILWTHFKHNGWSTKRPVDGALVRTFIERSGNMPLDFTFEVDGVDMELIDVLYDELFPHISRLRRLSLCIRSNGSSFPVAVLQCFESLPMENLEVLEIRIEGSDVMNPNVLENLPSNFRFIAPRLKMLRTDSRILHLTLSDDTISQLTHLQIDEGSTWAISIWKPFPLLLANATSLESLAISGQPFTIKFLSRVPLEPLSLPNLRYFSCMDDKIACNLSQFLNAPLLEELVLHKLNINSWDFIFESIPGRAPQNFPSIRRVAFVNCEPFNVNGPLRELALATGSTTKLTVANNFTAGTATDATTALANFVSHPDALDGQRRFIWPDLQELSCLSPSMSEQKYDTCVNASASRANNFPKTKRVTLRLLEKSVQDIRARVEEDIQDGYGNVELLPFSDYAEVLAPWITRDLFHGSAEEVFRNLLPI